MTHHGAKTEHHCSKRGKDGRVVYKETGEEEQLSSAGLLGTVRLALLAASCQHDNTCLQTEPAHSGALALGPMGSQEPEVCISSQLCISEHHDGSLKSATAGAFTPLKSASTLNQGLLLPRGLIAKHTGNTEKNS